MHFYIISYANISGLSSIADVLSCVQPERLQQKRIRYSIPEQGTTR